MLSSSSSYIIVFNTYGSSSHSSHREMARKIEDLER